ncbi:hypothetical protein [Nonomuraea sp. NPDC049695]|uniref:hypothetical protein n=1 Tax=Nonomuraea sp. NPDC049695 TaxID=3154734 RepID=UPI00342097E3
MPHVTAAGFAHHAERRTPPPRTEDVTMNSRKRLLRWAGGIMLVLRIGCLSLLTISAWKDVTGWVDRGMAAVPLDLSGDARPAESLQNALTSGAAREASPSP